MKEKPIDLDLTEKLLSETARISWEELQRFFAKGSLLQVDDSLDLVKVAVMFAEDDAKALEPLINSGHVAAPSNDVARTWFQSEAELWSVVVAPFVLVQESRNSQS